MPDHKVDNRRVRVLKEAPAGSGPVVYAMSRDQRASDNWALLYAHELARSMRQPVVVIALPGADSPNLSYRQAVFSVEGLRQAERQLAKLSIPFTAVGGETPVVLVRMLGQLKAGALVVDFSPLRQSRAWKLAVADKIDIPIDEVDAHNIVPAWVASDKQEYAAYTFRPKVNRLLGEFLTDFPRLPKNPHRFDRRIPQTKWNRLANLIASDKSVPPATGIEPGGTAARNTLKRFLHTGISDYADRRNDPVAGAQSGLSPYLHFGQISAQRVALEAQRSGGDLRSLESFLEELIVRRELSDNFCLYNSRYDSFDGFPAWARESLSEHRSDPREHIYIREEFEAARTHDELWNAAQLEMVKTGKMHGYLRMYWAKKILQWSVSPEEAFATALYLNDRYELDGNDPNGYTGVAWSIGGVHDRPWFERDIFGKVRYMSRSGCKRKFDINRYIANVENL